MLNNNFEFYFPDRSFNKIKKYEDYLLKKSGLSKDEFRKVLSRLFLNINLIKDGELLRSWDRAKEIMLKIDEEDVVFIACALFLGNDAVIWSDDGDFKEQNTIPVVTTSELVKWFKV